MVNGKKKKIKKASQVLVISLILLNVILLLTICYAAFADNFTITNTVGHVRVHKVVRINRVTTGSGAVTNLEYDSDSVLNTIYIQSGESATYSVTVTNLGNVPVAVSNVSFTSGNGNVSGLSSNISSSNYVKICDNNVCTNGVSKTFDVTITNNGSSTISTDLDVNLTFTEVYDIIYESNKIGEALAGSTFTYTFSGSQPQSVAKLSGTCDSFNYTNGTLTVTNVGSNMEFINAYTVNYNGQSIGLVADGGTFTKNMEPEFPATVTKTSGTCDSFTYQNHIITVTNVKSDINLTGVIGKVEITSIQYVQGTAKNVLENPPLTPTFHDMDAEFSITFQRPEGSTETDFEITYEVEITNSHYNDYIFRGLDFHPTIMASASSDTANLDMIPVDIQNGDVIAAETSRTFRITLKLVPSNPDGSYGTSVETNVDTTADTEEETGTITSSITPLAGNLQAPNTQASFTVEVTNTYPSDKQFRLISSNSNLEIVDSSGNALNNLTVHAVSTEQYTVYVQAVQGATFVGNTATMDMYLSSDGMANITVGSLTLAVDKYDVPDTTKVTVGNLQLSYYYDKANKRPTIKATWDRIDIGGTSITDYVVTAYRSNGNVAETCHTYSATRECLFTSLSENTSYYAIVYGIDQGPNSGASDVASATTANGYATRSAEASFVWSYTVNTSNVSDLAVGGDGSTAIRGASHTITITASGSSGGQPYTAPQSVTVRMDNSSGNFYTYARSGTNNTVGTIYIENVTGNISVTASRAGGCLIEGTKILLANGKYKNVEDIKYDDLVMAYSYDIGKLVATYPIYIETGAVTDKYQETTFSDGTVLKTYDYHGVYDPELKRFVSVDNPKEFHVGSKIAKISKDGFDEITVTKIETKHEPVKYYFFASTTYFNVIANDIITTDGNLALSNLYGFNDDMTWPKEIRNNALKDVYSYSELSDVMPYYMYKGMRAGEGKFLTNFGLDLSAYRQFIKMINDERIVYPINKFNKNMWMVTTSNDNVTNLNKHLYLRPEGSTYTLPIINDKQFIGWYSTSDNKIYQSGDSIIVYYGMHFEALYKH